MSRMWQRSPYVLIIDKKKNHIRSMLNGREYLLDNDDKIIWDMCAQPVDETWLIKQFGSKRMNALIHNTLLLQANKLYKYTNIKVIEVETCTWCNLQCKCCPQSINPRKPQIMEMNLFKEILNKAERHQSIELITLNLFNEPTVDPYFVQRLALIRKSRLQLVLNTNALRLNKKIIDILADMNNFTVLYANLTYLEEHENSSYRLNDYRSLILEQIRYAAHKGLQIKIILNGLPPKIFLVRKKWMHIFALIPNVEVINWHTNDRAGALKNEYNQNIHFLGKLNGCYHIINYLRIDVGGNLIICCNDYFKTQCYGKIHDGEISELLRATKAIRLRMQVFGAKKSNSDFICRHCSEMQYSIN